MVETIIGFVVLFGLLFLGLPIGVGLMMVGVVGFAVLTDVQPSLAMFGQIAYDTTLSYNLSVLPLFILMGNFISQSRLAEELYRLAYAFMGHLRGGLAMATVAASGGDDVLHANSPG